MTISTNKSTKRNGMEGKKMDDLVIFLKGTGIDPITLRDLMEYCFKTMAISVDYEDIDEEEFKNALTNLNTLGEHISKKLKQ